MLQRALLERLTGLVSTPVGDAVPAGVVALEAMRLIVEVVGEVSSDEVHQMRQPCITKLTAHPQPLQAQVPSPGFVLLLPRSECLQAIHHAVCTTQYVLGENAVFNVCASMLAMRNTLHEYTAVLALCHQTSDSLDCLLTCVPLR